MSRDVLRAIMRSNHSVLDELLNAGNDIFVVTEKEKWSYLHQSLLMPTLYPSAEMVKRLVDLGLSVDAIDVNGSTPLYYAVRLKNEPIIRILLESSNAGVNKANLDGITPLREAFSGKPYDYESIKTLLEFGADLDQRGDGCSIRELAHVLEGVDDSIMELMEKY